MTRPVQNVLISFPIFPVTPLILHLWNEQVTWRQLSACLLHLAVTLQLKGFQVVAALHHGFHLWLYLVDVETGDGELLLDRTRDLQGLEINEEEEQWEVSRNVLRVSMDESVCVCIIYTAYCLADNKAVYIEWMKCSRSWWEKYLLSKCNLSRTKSRATQIITPLRI